MRSGQAVLAVIGLLVSGSAPAAEKKQVVGTVADSAQNVPNPDPESYQAVQR